MSIRGVLKLIILYIQTWACIKKIRRKYHRMINLTKSRLESVKLILNKWVNSEISRLWITDNHSTDEKVILDVEHTHPLFPIIKMMQSLSDKCAEKSNQIIDLKSSNKSLSYELDQLKSTNPALITKHIQQEMKEIERQVTLAIQNSQNNTLVKIIDILNAFGMSIPKSSIPESKVIKVSPRSPHQNIKIEEFSDKEKTQAENSKKH